jgi:hypothetical protein
MGGRGHQLCGPIGKHFGASDFEAAPAEFDRLYRTVDSRCDDGGLLVDGDQMGLHGLETTDGAPELLTFAAVAQCHCRDSTYRAGHQRRTPQRGALPQRLFGDHVRCVRARGYRYAVENQCVTGLVGEVGSATDGRATRLCRRSGCDHHDAVNESDDMLGAVTPTHGGRRAEQSIAVETERGVRRQYCADTVGQRDTGGRQEPATD